MSAADAESTIDGPDETAPSAFAVTDIAIKPTPSIIKKPRF
jgi:hypothetical protein